MLSLLILIGSFFFPSPPKGRNGHPCPVALETATLVMYFLHFYSYSVSTGAFDSLSPPSFPSSFIKNTETDNKLHSCIFYVIHMILNKCIRMYYKICIALNSYNYVLLKRNIHNITHEKRMFGEAIKCKAANDKRREAFIKTVSNFTCRLIIVSVVVHWAKLASAESTRLHDDLCEWRPWAVQVTVGSIQLWNWTKKPIVLQNFSQSLWCPRKPGRHWRQEINMETRSCAVFKLMGS